MSLSGPAVVTGALGQDGFILCRQLRGRGVDVHGIVRPGGGHEGRRRTLEDLGCTLIELDVADTASLGALITKLRPNHIFHLAAAHHASGSAAETPDSWRAMIAVNLLATEAMAAAVAGSECAFVYASSSQIWTAREAEHRVDESTPPEPSTFYGHTKIWAADLLRQYRDRHGLKASVAILFNHESPWRSPAFVTRMISQAAANAARGAGAPLKLRNIGARTDWQGAVDVVDALILMAEAKNPDDYVLASGRSHSVRDFATAAYGHVGLDWRDWVTGERDEAGPVLVGVADKAKHRLGWRPAVAFEHMARDMVDADLARIDGKIST